MKKGKLTNKDMEELVENIIGTYKGDSGINFIDASNLPVRDKILEVLELLTELIFPGYTGKRRVTQSNINPPEFIFFVNQENAFHFSYKRYLENELRKEYGFVGTVIDLQMRGRPPKEMKE